MNPLTKAERNFLQHVTMWGSQSWPVRKVGRVWIWDEFWGVKGAPTPYKTKREAMGAVERYIGTLVDRSGLS